MRFYPAFDLFRDGDYPARVKWCDADFSVFWSNDDGGRFGIRDDDGEHYRHETLDESPMFDDVCRNALQCLACPGRNIVSVRRGSAIVIKGEAPA